MKNNSAECRVQSAEWSKLTRKRILFSFLCTLHSALLFCAYAADDSPTLPGKRPDGMVQLPNQWLLWPAGTQVTTADGAVNSALHPEGKYLAVQHAGYSAHEIAIVDLAEAKVVSSTKIDETFYGIQFSSDGKRLYCGGASSECIHVYAFDSGQLKPVEKLQIRDVKQRGIPGGLAVRKDGSQLYTANVWGQRVSRVDLTGDKKVLDITLGAADATHAPAIKLPDALDEAALVKRAAAQLDPTSPSAPFPYACALDEQRSRLYVSLWALGEVAVLDTEKNTELARWKTEEHPCEMLLAHRGKILYVANANRNTVTVLDTATGRPLETLWCAIHPDTPPGTSPISLALTPDEKTLFVANAGENNVAVFDVDDIGKSVSLGFIPAGWYPTSVRVTPDGRTLAIVNGKGGGSLPNAAPPGSKKTFEYIGSLLKSTVSIVALPPRAQLKEKLAEFTAHAFACTPDKINAARVAKRAADNPIPDKIGAASPLKYCIYIVKENRTYDQVLGDMKQGNGDVKLCLFPQNVTPNHHKLAEEFVLLDNFYVDGEVSADGHEWTCAAYATDFVEKFWPLSYGHDRSGKFPYPSEGVFPVAAPARGYLWDRCVEANVSYRSYGEFATSPKNGKPGKANLKALEGHIDQQYHTFDTNYSDILRAERFISELKRFEGEGEMPRLQIVRLPNDHTAGTGAGSLTPTAFLAQNDLALGMVVEAISKSKFWPQTAIFCIEDDAQNGPDHVDAHRSLAFVASPYSRRKVVDSNMYSTSSMLRTMELILGLKPMSQYDAAALPMFNSFQAAADLTPFTKLPANVDLEAHNKKTAFGSAESDGMDFTREDANDDLQLNEIVWRSVRGADSPMPAPVRAAFVFAYPEDDGD